MNPSEFMTIFHPWELIWKNQLMTVEVLCHAEEMLQQTTAMFRGDGQRCKTLFEMFWENAAPETRGRMTELLPSSYSSEHGSWIFVCATYKSFAEVILILEHLKLDHGVSWRVWVQADGVSQSWNVMLIAGFKLGTVDQDTGAPMIMDWVHKRLNAVEMPRFEEAFWEIVPWWRYPSWIRQRLNMVKTSYCTVMMGEEPWTVEEERLELVCRLLGLQSLL